MRASRAQLVGVLLPLAAVAACRANPAPRGWLAPAEDAVADPYGAWVVVELQGAPESAEVRGELIAVSDDSVFVLTQAADFRALPRSEVTQALVASYVSRYDLLAMWSTLGTVATISHGWFAALSAPVWLIAGPIATASESRVPLEDVKPRRSSWADVSKYARFPQGMPPGLDRSQMFPKSTARRRR